MVTFSGKSTSGVIHRHPAGYDENTIMIRGTAPGATVVQWFAADPAQRVLSKAGSYQAFPSPNIAITGSNCGTVEVAGGVYTFICHVPNSYYANGGTILLPPHITIRVWDHDQCLGDTIATLDTMIPFRGLTYAPQRRDSTFYAGQLGLPPRTQQQILEARSKLALGQEIPVRRYAEDFWGSVPRP
jgi:hypothetical protein